MKTKTSVYYGSWLFFGTATLLVFMLAVLLFNLRAQSDIATQLAAKMQRLERVDRIQVALASAVEAEKCAVLAITDSESQQFVEQTRTAVATVERERGELVMQIADSGKPDEKELVQQFTAAFGEFQRIDKDLLALAVKNTNLKASGLVFGPAAEALAEMDAALARLPGDTGAGQHLADTARIAAWRLLTLLPPHIAEENDAKMDALEALMTTEDRKVQQALETLAAQKELANRTELHTAATQYARFGEWKAEVLKLSRENTNVRSLAISLNEKRKATRICQAVLTQLHQAIEAEPSVTLGHINPR